MNNSDNEDLKLSTLHGIESILVKCDKLRTDILCADEEGLDVAAAQHIYIAVELLGQVMANIRLARIAQLRTPR